MQGRLSREIDRAVLAFALGVAVLASSISFAQTSSKLASDVHETVLRGGRVIDPESGLDAVRDVGIDNGVITAISAEGLQGRRIVDVSGLVVAPGFIDLDTYARLGRFHVADGVTTIINFRVGTADVDAWYSQHTGRMPVNFGIAVGFLPIRVEVVGKTEPDVGYDPRVVDEDQLLEILRRMERGLVQGAIGVGMGGAKLRGPTNRELLETFQLAARYEAPVSATLRDIIWADADVAPVFSEWLGAAALTGVSLHIPHLPSSAGPYTERLLEMIGRARARGFDVTAEGYPYTGSVNSLDYAADELLEWTDDELQDVLLLATNERLVRDDILIYRTRDPGIVFLNSYIAPFVDASIASPLTSIASHGWLDDQLRGHPRTSGTYSKVLGRHVREQARLTLMEALRKMSLMPTQRLELRVPAMKKKGRLQVGADADIVIFDANQIIDRATFQEPTLPPEGVHYVFVNGIAVVSEGSVQEGVHPGEAIRSPLHGQRSGTVDE